MKLFSDSTSLFTVVYDTHRAAEDLNSDLRSIEDWAFKWRMSFNPDPMKQARLIFSRKCTTANHHPLYFNGIQVARVDEHKHLGIILDSKLSFSQHIRSLIAKVKQGVGMLRFMSRYPPRKTLDEMHKYVHIWIRGCHIPHPFKQLQSHKHLSLELPYGETRICTIFCRSSYYRCMERYL